jgi:CheY-like chemotaxis protein
MTEATDDDAGTGIKVMVIDDSKTIRRTAETLLKREGYVVVTATDGYESLSKIADERPDIIFVDIMMPRLDGYQTCALIKNNRELPHQAVHQGRPAGRDPPLRRRGASRRGMNRPTAGYQLEEQWPRF